MTGHRRLAAWALPLAVLALVAGCGVPSRTEVVVEGTGQPAGRASDDQGVSEPPLRNATTDVAQFVTNFLAAAAGTPDQALQRVAAFVSPEVPPWKPDPEVRVIRLAPGQPVIRDGSVSLTAIVLGVLDRNGTVEPRAQTSLNHRFTVTTVERQTGLWVADPPPFVLLSDTALDRYFDQRPLYFWSQGEHSTLVPDLRYLPRALPASKRPTEIIRRLLLGPSDWLAKAVRALPDGAQLVGNVPDPSGGKLVVELSRIADTADQAEIDRLATQLRWSLRPPIGADQDLDLDLKIDQVAKLYKGSGYLSANPSYRAGVPAESFCVFRGQIRRLGAAGRRAGPDPGVPPQGILPLTDLPAATNTGILNAALSRRGGGTVAALVRTRTDGRVRLDVGPVSAVGATSLVARRISQPSWLPGARLGLVLADGVLRSFSIDSPQTPRVAGGSGITAMAVPPDGRRIAYVRGGRLYVAALIHDELGASLRTPRAVPTSLTGLTAVGWSQQDWLVVAGARADGLTSFVDLTVDGAVEDPEARSEDPGGNSRVTHLVAFPDDPSNGPDSGQVMYMLSGLPYVLFGAAWQLTSADVVGLPSTSPGTADVPTAPFFVS